MLVPVAELDESTTKLAEDLFHHLHATLEETISPEAKARVNSFEDALFHATIDACYDLVLSLAVERRAAAGRPVNPSPISMQSTMACIGEIYTENMYGEIAAGQFRQALEGTGSLDSAVTAVDVEKAIKRRRFN